MEKAILLPLTYLIGIAEVGLGIFFWATHSKSEIRKVMALLSLSTGLWVLCSALLAYRSNLLDSTLLINAFVYVFGILLLTALVHVSVIFPRPLWRLDTLHRVLLYIPVVLLTFIAFSTRLIELSYISDSRNVGKVVAGPLLPFYNAWLLVLYLLALVLIYAQSKKSDGFLRKNSLVLFWSVVVGGLPAVYVDLVAPIITPNNVPNFLYGVLCSVVWFAATFYTITKKS